MLIYLFVIMVIKTATCVKKPVSGRLLQPIVRVSECKESVKFLNTEICATQNHTFRWWFQLW